MEINGNGRKIVIYGGNGFVGCKVAECLANAGAEVVCVSRTGEKPAHLQDSEWADNVAWVKGDASEPELALLQDTDALICVIGSPPIPAVGKEAYDRQVFTNGVTNSRAITAAGDAGINRIVLLGAKIPAFLDGDWFGYAKGKRLALAAAREFSQLSEEHSAVVLQPGAIFGKRHTASGTEIPIDLVMRPLSQVLGSQLVSVEKVAGRIAAEALATSEQPQSLNIIKHADI
ncbi:MAG: NAD(P)H-binding protein [Gammaproteobacteria bacterium]|nr:NAD(P)H-binding protein [Gammaproteobacteria bacterium]